MISSRAELVDEMRARGLHDTPPPTLRRAIPRPDTPGRAPSRFYREELAAELERRRTDPEMSLPPAVPGGPRLVLLQDDQDADPLLGLLNAAAAEERHEHFRHELPAIRRRRAVEPVLARAAAKQRNELHRRSLAFKLATREREII
jgi:hypothetical protein